MNRAEMFKKATEDTEKMLARGADFLKKAGLSDEEAEFQADLIMDSAIEKYGKSSSKNDPIKVAYGDYSKELLEYIRARRTAG